LAAVLGGALFIISDLLAAFTFDPNKTFSEVALTGSHAFSAGLGLVGGILLVLGLVALYAYRTEAMGILGLLAFVVAFFGSVLAQGVIWADAFVVPSLAVEAPELLDGEPPGLVVVGLVVSFGLANVGWLLFGVVTLRARLYPRLASVLLIVGSLVGIALSAIPSAGSPGAIQEYVGVASDIVFNGAIAWLGFALWTGGDR
jgi:hypothetical protein